jgi:hypothetical protein
MDEESWLVLHLLVLVEAHDGVGPPRRPLNFTACALVEVFCRLLKGLYYLVDQGRLYISAPAFQNPKPVHGLNQVIKPVADVISAQVRTASGNSEDQFGSSVGGAVEVAESALVCGGSLLPSISGFLDSGLPAIGPGGSEQCRRRPQNSSNKSDNGGRHRSPPDLFSPEASSSLPREKAMVSSSYQCYACRSRHRCRRPQRIRYQRSLHSQVVSS